MVATAPKQNMSVHLEEETYEMQQDTIPFKPQETASSLTDASASLDNEYMYFLASIMANEYGFYQLTDQLFVANGWNISKCKCTVYICSVALMEYVYLIYCMLPLLLSSRGDYK